eukprot:TRINITY_DN4252_c0_g2_i1.p1 TRINITY_DN4252_c0_g2~~TRINITY_DN4252_c0_g2_i1.p1  ORF type:complete len:520 (+),score=180.71 TRINITY_DN4252_c0_g2_i1:796-2355(+)
MPAKKRKTTQPTLSFGNAKPKKTVKKPKKTTTTTTTTTSTTSSSSSSSKPKTSKPKTSKAKAKRTPKPSPKKKRKRLEEDSDYEQDDEDDLELSFDQGESEYDENGQTQEDRNAVYAADLRNKIKGTVSQVLAKVTKAQQAEKRLRSKPRKKLSELGLSNVRKEVAQLEEESVLEEIEKLIFLVAQSVMKGEGFSFTVPTRGASNTKYIEELDQLVLMDKTTNRSFGSQSTAHKTAVTTKILQLVHELCTKRIHATKRDLFYCDVKLFKTQGKSDTVLEDTACLLGCTRSSMNVVASEKGVVVGCLRFLEDGDAIDCTRMGVGGKAIPSMIDKITDIESDAQFILLVEKDAAFMRLAEDRFYKKYPCIIITAKGQPDVSTRLFLHKLVYQLKIPVLGLVDSDPYGLKILSVYASGSKNMAFDSSHLTTPNIKWLGVRPSDLQKYKIPKQCQLDMTEKDIQTGKQMLKEDFILKNPEWAKELQWMVKHKVKAEIQSLSAFGFQYLTEVYLPLKLQNGDWI